MRIHSRHRGQSGFSLIEVMIAVIVLATGLLALAALQINLTSSSADAKARSRIAALMASAIDDQRASGYSSIACYGVTGCTPSTPISCTTSSPTTLQTAICTAQSDAGVSDIKLTQTVTRYYGLSGASTFTTTTPASTATGYGDYKQIQLTATWTDATGTARSLGATTIASDLGLTASSTLLSQTLTTSASKTPIVHETNPGSTAGVIPIAVGNNTDAASTNPRPNVTLTVPSTTFTTLTYTPDSGLSTATIQKRVETTVTECVCQSSSTNPLSSDVFLGASTFRPTYWNGLKYIAPTDAKITPYSAQYSGLVGSQDDLCTVCCRDHHDKDSSGTNASAPLFDPVTGDKNRYAATLTTSGSGSNTTTTVALTLSGGNPVAASMTGGTNSIYLDACRLIRVDGIWHVASDMQSRHMGLLATSPSGTATSSTPDSTAETNYETFVVDYLGLELKYLLGLSGTEPDPNSTTVGGFNYATYALNLASSIPLSIFSTPTDYRYLHARGLYLDYLEPAAITKLTSVNSTCAAADYPTCLLPFLPFNTINVTQLAKWVPLSQSSTQTGTLSVTNSSTSNTATACSSTAQIRACVSGISAGATGSGTDSAVVTMEKSNSAVAASLDVSPWELLASHSFTDSQAFSITGASTPQKFFVSMTGPNVTVGSNTFTFPSLDISTTNDPTVAWSVPALSGSGFCTASSPSHSSSNSSPWTCNTTTALTTPVDVTVSGYNQVQQVAITNPCPGATGSAKNAKYNQPTLVCYTVSGASVSAGGYNTSFSVSGSKTTAEQTLIAITGNGAGITSLTNNSTLSLTFSANGSAIGSYTCNVSNVPTFTTPTSCN